ncbi:MAG: hypothetical protein J3K34DRAFT_61352 [Monoraphidium minutum]|nr:MAG: hypothetical protein J3K34DRAFT_61352 [Monoraphidium minutum]
MRSAAGLGEGAAVRGAQPALPGGRVPAVLAVSDLSVRATPCCQAPSNPKTHCFCSVWRRAAAVYATALFLETSAQIGDSILRVTQTPIFLAVPSTRALAGATCNGCNGWAWGQPAPGAGARGAGARRGAAGPRGRGLQRSWRCGAAGIRESSGKVGAARPPRGARE